ncbi:MAG: tRNA 4-thiouridine(8) synthase ThiI [Gemmatimonadota bacterium]|nr:tRNA 4-thiouridine(8) synthase ThiI [Gemmatimonadota bacterium]MDE2983785.1 tRNA 4-thiouridine(8) synthase ThiI [Gemmatimonadota bacterium]
MSATPNTHFIVRLAAEVASKSNRTRRRFHKRLVANLKDALSSSDTGSSVSDRWSRLFVTVPDAGAMSAARRVFGISSFSEVDAVVPADLETIVRAGHESYREAVTGRRYAVAARRTGRQSFSSQDIRVELGAALNPYGTVDLTTPEVTVSVEVRDDRAYLFAGRVEGPGGLPLGVQGRAVCLISGGFDSAVAAWLLLKRGVALDYVFCNLAGPAFERSVIQVTRVLADRWSYGDRPRMHVVDFGDAVRDLQDRVTPRYWQVVLKRLMYRAAGQVAGEIGADALVTGESLGQVSSQTLRNLRAIEAVAALPVLRPLVGFDKEEIIRIAKRIGTAALSARVREYCAILAGKPVTAAKVGAVDREEAPVDLALVDRAVAERRVLDVRSVQDADLNRDYLWTDVTSDGSRVIDCRPAHQDDGWRHPGSRRILPSEFPALAGKLQKTGRYVLFCDNGTQSAQLANLLQTVGYEAYALKGGTRALRHGSGPGSTRASTEEPR